MWKAISIDNNWKINKTLPRKHTISALLIFFSAPLFFISSCSYLQHLSQGNWCLQGKKKPLSVLAQRFNTYKIYLGNSKEEKRRTFCSVNLSSNNLIRGAKPELIVHPNKTGNKNEGHWSQGLFPNTSANEFSTLVFWQCCSWWMHTRNDILLSAKLTEVRAIVYFGGTRTS